MGWIIKTEPKPAHTCPTPDITSAGDVWQCDDCSSVWQVAPGRRFKLSWVEVEVAPLGIRGIACGRGICALGLLHAGKCKY